MKKNLLFTALSVLAALNFQTAFAGPPPDKNASPWVGNRFDGAPCLPTQPQGYGPYDYTKRSAYTHELSLVEGAHFNAKVESLKGGAKYKDNLYGDIDYTLRAFPNHHRALNTLIRYRILSGGYKRADLQQPECYLQRALNFAPEDATTHMLYGLYYHKLDMLDDALTKYEKALSLSPNNIEIQYNLALLLTEMERFEEAKQYAINVYAKKYPLQGLKNRLKASGHW